MYHPPLTVRATPVEYFHCLPRYSSRYPVILNSFGLRRGSGGAGARAGGDGVFREMTFRKDLTVSVLSERRAFRPWGLAGGLPAARGVSLFCYYHAIVMIYWCSCWRCCWCRCCWCRWYWRRWYWRRSWRPASLLRPCCRRHLPCRRLPCRRPCGCRPAGDFVVCFRCEGFFLGFTLWIFSARTHTACWKYEVTSCLFYLSTSNEAKPK